MMLQPLKTKAPQRQEIVGGDSIVAPYKGWNARDPESLMKPGYAKYLENLVPSGTSVDLRPGAADHKTGYAKPVKALMAFQSALGSGSSKLFSATDDGIFDATASGAVGATVMALTDGWCTHANYRTSANSFLLVCNGVDSVKSFDGTTWSSVATYSISGGGTLNGSDVINFCVHNRRLWFVKKGSADVYYLPVDVVTGSVTLLPLGGYIPKGGFIIAAYTWTIDGGAGSDDDIVFVSSEGQLIVYAGTDPASIPGSFKLQGVYNMPRPIGRKCGYKLGSDLLFITEGGVYSLTAILRSKEVTQDLALSDLIRPEISQATQLYNTNRGWQISGLLARNLILVNVPTTEASKAYQYGMNTTSQGWWLNNGWNALCFEEFNNQIYGGFATKVGKVWSGVLDFGSNVTAFARGHFDYLGSRGRTKRPSLFRPVVKVNGSVSISARLDPDFSRSNNYGPTTFGTTGGSAWDVALWDTGTWTDDQTPVLDWRTAACKPFYAVSVSLRVVTNGGTFSWSVTDMVYETGARVVG